MISVASAVLWETVSFRFCLCKIEHNSDKQFCNFSIFYVHIQSVRLRKETMFEAPENVSVKLRCYEFSHGLNVAIHQ